MKRFWRQHKEILSLTLRLIVAAALFLLALENYNSLTHLDVRAIVGAASGAFTAVSIIWGIYFVKSILFVIPASLIYMYVGMAFDHKWAVLINLAGIAIEVSATYLLGRFLGGSYVERMLEGKKFGERLKRIRSRNKTWAVLAIRALPVFPIDFVSLLLGAYRDPFLPYFFISVIGIAPRVVLFTLLGDGIYRYIPMRQMVLVIICCIPAVAVYWVLRYLRKRRLRNTDSH